MHSLKELVGAFSSISYLDENNDFILPEYPCNLNVVRNMHVNLH